MVLLQYSYSTVSVLLQYCYSQNCIVQYCQYCIVQYSQYCIVQYSQYCVVLYRQYCIESVPWREEGSRGKYQHEVKGVPKGAAQGNWLVQALGCVLLNTFFWVSAQRKTEAESQNKTRKVRGTETVKTKYTTFLNPAYGRHWTSWPMQIAAPILFPPLFFIRRMQIMDKFSSRRQSYDGRQEHIFFMSTEISRPGGYEVYRLASNMPKSPKKPQAAARQIFVPSPK